MTARGFTLAEVLLSVALTATTLLGLVSLLAEGLNSVGASTHMTLSTQIARSLMAQTQSADWQLGTGYMHATASPMAVLCYFDDQGMSVSDSDVSRIHYTARISWDSDGVVLPGAVSHLHATAPTNPFSRQFTIQIAAGPAKDLSFFDDPSRRSDIHTVHSVRTSRMPVLTSVP